MALLDRLTLLIDADGSRAVGELDRLGRKTKETLSVGQQFGRDFLKGLGVGAGAASGFVAADAVQRLARFSVDAARAAEEDARAQVVLSMALESNAAATYRQVRAVEAFISTTSTATGVVDDDLRPALATLVRSTNDAESAQRLLTLALDISVGTGRDVDTVAQALAKTYEGNTTALARLVPEVTSVVKEGGTMLDVFNELEQSFGGTAKETADQAGGFGRLKVSAGELKEEYGRGLTPAVNVLADAMSKLNAGVAGQSLGSLAAASSPIVGLLGSLSGSARSVKEVAELMGDLPNSFASAATAAGRTGEVLARGFKPEIVSSTIAVRGFQDALADLASSASKNLAGIFGVSDAEDRFADALDGTTNASGGATRATRDLIAEQFNLERSARSVLQAELDLLDAENELETVRKGASDREKKRAGLDVAEAQNRVAQAQRRIAEATNDLNRATGRRGNTADAVRARQALADAILEEERAREDLIDTEERANDTMRRGTKGSEDLAAATKKVEDAQWNLRDAIEAQRQQAMQDQTDGGPVGRSARQQRDSFREAAQAASEIIIELTKAGAPQDVINEKIAEMVIRLQAAGTAAGATKKEIQEAADLLIALGAVAQAEQQRSLAGLHGFGYFSLREELDAMRRQGIYVPDSAYQLAGGRAGGGSTNAGMSYTVGENGRETLTMGNSPGWVTPNGGGGNTFQFNGPVVAEKVTLERLLTDALDSARRRGYNN